VGPICKTFRQPASLAPLPPDRAPLSAPSPRLTRAVPTARSPGPKPPPRSEVDRRCPSALTAAVRPSDAVTSFVHGERRPSSPLAVLHPWSVELTFPSLLTVAGPLPATVAPPHRRNATAEPNFFSSPSTRSSDELAFRPPCPASSLTVVGARPPPFAPSPPLWHRRRPSCACGLSRRRGRGPGATVHLGRAWFRPRGTQIDFSIF
jgi:hypothetical protein